MKLNTINPVNTNYYKFFVDFDKGIVPFKEIIQYCAFISFVSLLRLDI